MIYPLEQKRQKLEEKTLEFFPNALSLSSCIAVPSTSKTLSNEQRQKCKLTTFEIAELVAKSPHSL